MKVFLYLATIFLSVYASKTVSAEPTKLIPGEWVVVRTSCSPYSQTLSKIKPELMSQEEAVDFDRFLFLNSFPFDDTTCTPHIYPELVKLYRDVKNKQFDKTKSDFLNSTFVSEFINIHKTEFIMAWNRLDNPFDAIRFPFYFNSDRLVIAYRRNNKAVDDVLIKIVLEDFQKYIQKRHEEIKENNRKILDNKNKETAKSKELYLEYLKKIDLEKIESYYISQVIEKKEKIIEESKAFITLGVAKDEQDFYEKLVLTCYRMSCNKSLQSKFNDKVKNKLAFRNFSNLSVVTFFVQRNDLVSLKKFIANNPRFEVSYEEVRLSASLYDSEILNYFINDLRKKYYEKNDSNGLKGNDSRLTEMLSKSFQDPVNNTVYDLYFMSKYKKLKTAHVLGYVSFSSADLEYLSQMRNVAESKTDSLEVNTVTFENSSWESKTTPFEKAALNELYDSSDKSIWHDPRKIQNILYEEFSSGQGLYAFNEFDGEWFKLISQNGSHWLHKSQVAQVVPIEEFIRERGSRSINADTALYHEPNGKKVNLEISQKLGTDFTILQSKWIGKDLWLNINLYEAESDEAEAESDEKGKLKLKPRSGMINIWIKAFNGPIENFRTIKYAC